MAPSSVGSCSLNTDLYSLEGYIGPKGEEQRQWENSSGIWVTGIKTQQGTQWPGWKMGAVAKPESLNQTSKEAARSSLTCHASAERCCFSLQVRLLNTGKPKAPREFRWLSPSYERHQQESNRSRSLFIDRLYEALGHFKTTQNWKPDI